MAFNKSCKKRQEKQRSSLTRSSKSELFSRTCNSQKAKLQKKASDCWSSNPLALTERPKMIGILQILKLQTSYKRYKIKLYINHMSNLQIPNQIYRWMVSELVIENTGQMSDRNIVVIPQSGLNEIENGIVVAKIIYSMLRKGSQSVPQQLSNLKNSNDKTTKLTNWNFIWLCFDNLRMQVDSRIKDLIVQGQNALVVEIIKQLYDRDENKKENQMKNVPIKQKEKQSAAKSEIKGKSQSVKGVLDIKKINLQKDPSQSQSSLEFLILLLANSFNMPVEEILGLFTNQNKYLAHLIVKGFNEDFTGVILFYNLLAKNTSKLKEFLHNDSKDGESCLYAVKPGLISKNQKVAQLTIGIFLSVKGVYEWFVSEQGKCSTTLFLGIKRHPQIASLYWDLLLHMIENEEMTFFTNEFKRIFRDAEEMTEICTYIIDPMSSSFIKDNLIEIGIVDQWAQIAQTLFTYNSIESKLLSFKFMGEMMRFLPNIILENEEYLLNYRKGWKEKKMVEYIHLIDEILLTLEKLAGEKNVMAKKLYQIIIEIFVSIMENEDKRQYLLQSFLSFLPNFPKIPTQFIIENYKDSHLLKTFDYKIIKLSITITTDPYGLVKIGQSLLKIFANNATLNHFLAKHILEVCQKVFKQQAGKNLIKRAIKELLDKFSQIEVTKKSPKEAKQQPMYLIHKANYNYNKSEQDDYLVLEKSSKNLISLVDKLIDLSIIKKIHEVQKFAKNELLETNAFIKKNHYKTTTKALSNILAKKFSISREQQQQFNEDFKVRRSLISMEDSMAKRKLNSSANMPLASSRYGGPENLRKQFDEVTDKRKRQQEEKRFQDQKKQRQEAFKKILNKKELEKTNLLRGFIQQAELKEDGFWQRFNREDKQQLELYPPNLMEQRDTQYIENLFKKYHRVVRSLFLKYTSSMYVGKTNTSFEGNKERNQTLNTVELIKFLKDFKLFFLTSKEQIQNLVRELNVKLLNKRQPNELDFHGFEQFIIQFCSVIYTKTHTINANTTKGLENIKKNLGHLSHLQLVEEWFNYLKLVFVEKGQKISIFDEPEAAYFNQTEVIKQFTKRLEEDPTFILPQGYKKISEKQLTLTNKMSFKTSIIPENYQDVLQVLDELLSQSELKFHIIQPLIQKQTKIRVKPNTFVNIKAKLMEAGQSKVRALSSIIDKKPAIPPIKMLERKNLSFGMKLGLSYVSYKEKMLGEQVAYILDDMLTAVQNGRATIQKQKIVNEYLKKRNEQVEKQKFNEIDKEKKRLQRKNQLQRIKKEIAEKKEKEQQENKEDNQKKKKKKEDKQKRVKEDKEKYLSQQKKKLQEKKQKGKQDENKKKQQKKKNRELSKKKKEQFTDFNAKQVDKFKKQFEADAEKKKKEQQKVMEEEKKKHELVSKLRSKIHQSDKKKIELKHKVNEQIQQLYQSEEIKIIYKQFQSSVRALFDFLLKSSYYSITQKKNNNEIIQQTWISFSFQFQLNPFIVNSKELLKIFRFFSKDKQTNKDYHIGLTFDEFKQALLRLAIKHKSIFNKLSQKIKDEMSQQQIGDVVQKDIEEKQKNEFEQPKQIDVRSLIKESDINKDLSDHYGDIGKVNENTLKALIYYLKIPKDKKGQQNRFREVLASKISYSLSNNVVLKEKLNDQYSLPLPQKKKRRTEANESSLMKESLQIKKEQEPEE